MDGIVSFTKYKAGSGNLARTVCINFALSAFLLFCAGSETQERLFLFCHFCNGQNRRVASILPFMWTRLPGLMAVFGSAHLSECTLLGVGVYICLALLLPLGSS